MYPIYNIHEIPRYHPTIKWLENRRKREVNAFAINLYVLLNMFKDDKMTQSIKGEFEAAKKRGKTAKKK